MSTPNAYAPVADLNQTPQDRSSGGPFAWNGSLYLSRTTDALGSELWRSDGTPSGTTLVADLVVGTGSSSPTDFLSVGTKLLFRAGGALYATDGTTNGTVQLVTGSVYELNRAAVLNGTAYLAISGNDKGAELWRTDGTRAGTQMVRDIFSGSNSSMPRALTVWNDRVAFTADDGASGRELWITDGTTSGTSLWADVVPGTPGTTVESITPVGDSLVVNHRPDNASVSSIARIARGPAGNAVVVSLDLTNLAGSPFVRNGVLVHTQSVGGGNPRSFLRAIDLLTGQAATIAVVQSHIQWWAPLGAGFVFSTLYGSPSEVWYSDGTASGTRLLHTMPSEFDREVAPAPSFGGVPHVFFASDASPNTGTELWVTNGTVAGTRLLGDLRPGPGYSSPTSFTALGATGYFQALISNAPDIPTLWRTDGTTEGTFAVDTPPGTNASSFASGFVKLGDHVLFSANDGIVGQELWSADASLATSLVKDIAPGTPEFSSSPDSSAASELTPIGDGTRAVFQARTPQTGSELFITDGTTAGTLLLRDIRTGTTPSNPQRFVAMDNGLVVFVATGQEGTELWRTDGTPGGTAIVADLTPGSASTSFIALHRVDGDRVVIFHDSTQTGRRVSLFNAPTISVTTLANLPTSTSGGFSIGNSSLVSYGGVAYFAYGRRQLWRTDFTAAGTYLARQFTFDSPFDEVTVIGATPQALALQASAGLLLLSNVATDPVNMLPFVGARPSLATNLPDGSLLFSGSAPGGVGIELCRTDGTIAGTHRVRDINPGSASSNPKSFALLNGVAYLLATTAEHGTEVWMSDGTAEGTRLVHDAFAGPNSSSISSLIPIDDAIWTAADDGLIGVEPVRFVDVVAPRLLEKTLGHSGSDPLAAFCFSERLAIAPSATVTDLASGAAVDPLLFVVTADLPTGVVSIRLRSELPDSRYRVELTPTTVVDRSGNAATEAAPGLFEVILIHLRGDATGDGTVNFDDLLRLAAHYNQPSTSYDEGDFDGSGAVDFDDLLILAANYNRSLAGLPAWGLPGAAPMSAPPAGVLADEDRDEGGSKSVLG